MDVQNDGEQQGDNNENDRNTIPKITKLFSRAMDQFRLRVFFLFLERLYIIISMSIILVLLSLQNCGWNDLHYWVLFSSIQAVFSLILYGQLFHFSNIQSIQQHLAFHYVQIVFVPINEVTDHPVAPEVYDPTANLSTMELDKKADIMQLQIRQEIVNQSKFCKYNNIFSNVTNQAIFIWTIYYIVANPYESSKEVDCNKWPIIQTYIYGSFLFLQYSQYYLLVALALVILPFILIYLLIRCFTDRKKKQEALRALNDLQKKKILYKPNILEGEQECSICMQPYQTDDEVLQMPCSTLHHFHNTCISAWLQIQSTCPNCRQQLLPENLQPLLQQQQQQQQEEL
ncbi:unnamed protein product [Paramecium primaurelia]|uniref:RING-type domain-containing protein n=1 Tax=Paramecium primaurelia TaxID=5886 RepID=A0A8S1KRI5_PARPR|nr:unnamed protein product [Paramecium primaurelia]